MGNAMIERVALAMVNSDNKRFDLPILNSVEDFRLAHDRSVYEEMASIAIEATATEVSIKPMRLSDDRTDYFVSFKHGEREVTPHVFRERFKAEYHVALYRWLFGQTDEEPEVLAFSAGEWPARTYTAEEREAFDAMATLKYCEKCWSEERGTMIDKIQAERARADRAETALRAIGEGNLGDASWQADYEKIRTVARAALAPTEEA
ncbi:hypothetical protein [Mesorhizobium sp.]|uniref:hypothetical protein n=1 Tax=Mesorhizobium sp. TaxID=1871066 RepID=UPI000FE85097|nr:hypothetical protein [Mesorhizobium sp.]RWB67614.1 MAG: hypothetical protein EOQ49_25170 [Mesorhizobium sp.]